MDKKIFDYVMYALSPLGAYGTAGMYALDCYV
jgi:hypothetical protein